MEIIFKHYVISNDKAKLDINTICDFLAKSYWANTRSKDKIQKSIENSLCYGVYDGNKQIAFARIVTDGATMYWLGDVFVDESYRGEGIGTKLIDIIVNAEENVDLFGLLGTKDAHGLYGKYDFKRDEYMVRNPNYIKNERS
ncbi:GNAT family N-acetyltransferase [Chengkuizengella axinellae]|uniref:GNAT family N-acetyltransferase n=1 Tax=Chengkuizengella axinellae TaxID=3064388 RepID=A0ABT9IX12_9BACL|nr:GNAT family N-acetyltransferase [Chengkuizengella sp. 2205SS18-9]MDP5273909.1 GNAT family N-acetyltransferase [Chengkuizengella sp. 2205SS18-9]